MFLLICLPNIYDKYGSDSLLLLFLLYKNVLLPHSAQVLMSILLYNPPILIGEFLPPEYLV